MKIHSESFDSKILKLGVAVMGMLIVGAFVSLPDDSTLATASPAVDHRETPTCVASPVAGQSAARC